MYKAPKKYRRIEERGLDEKEVTELLTHSPLDWTEEDRVHAFLHISFMKKKSKDEENSRFLAESWSGEINEMGR